MSVSILLGSVSDKEKMQGAIDALSEFGISYEFNVISAHRSPHLVVEHVESAPSRGIKVFICGAGMAAHLAGVVSGNTTLPVVGVPLSGSALNGHDALLSTVQMPKGVPVATVAIDGSYNAGILAVQMLALSDDTLAKKLVDFKAAQVKKIEQANASL